MTPNWTGINTNNTTWRFEGIRVQNNSLMTKKMFLTSNFTSITTCRLIFFQLLKMIQVGNITKVESKRFPGICKTVKSLGTSVYKKDKVNYFVDI